MRLRMRLKTEEVVGDGEVVALTRVLTSEFITARARKRVPDTRYLVPGTQYGMYEPHVPIGVEIARSTSQKFGTS